MFKFLGKLVVKGFVLLVGLLVCLVACVAFMGGDSDTNSSDTNSSDSGTQEQQEVKQNTDVDKYQVQILDSRSDGFATYITGTLVADRDYSYVQILIPCYDVDGNKLGDAIANVNNLNKGESWKFEAMSIDTNVASFDINKAEVDAF